MRPALLVRVTPLCAGLGLLVLLVQLARGFALERAALTAFGVGSVLYLVCLAVAAVALRSRHPRSPRAA